MYFKFGCIVLFQFLIFFVSVTFSQDTNPVEREVANPLADTSKINSVLPDRKLTRTTEKRQAGSKQEGDDELFVYSERVLAKGEKGKRIVIHEGNVDVRYGDYRLQADRITIYEVENKIFAEGSVVFDQGEMQRITGSKATWNYQTKLGKFTEATGYTNQTNDGTIVYFTADEVSRTKLNEIVLKNGEFTACEDVVPKWSFTASKATILTDDKVKLKNPKFRIKNFPIAVLPYLTISLKKNDRSSGFLTPTFGHAQNKGFRLSGAYYQTLGRSADVTIRGDLFSARGIGYGADLRTRLNSRSFFNAGFYGVKDRIFGAIKGVQTPDQGGTSVYAKGIHHFSNGFVTVADVRLTSSLTFRQVFSENIQQAISPIEVSQAFVNKSWDDYTLNIIARSQEISIPDVQVKLRSRPSIHFEKRPSPLKFFNNVYFSFKTSLDGISRREKVANVQLYRKVMRSEPIILPPFSQRFDVNPQITIPFNTKYFSLVATVGARATYYSNSFNDKRQVADNNILRKYGEFEIDFRPVALARNFYRKNDSFRFRHVIEPYVTYRYVNGINNFRKIIRFDYEDIQTDTNEIEFGITNRFFTSRYNEAGMSDAIKELQQNVDSIKRPIQPHEIFTFTMRGKYFFDPYFGNALATGQRNQFKSITDLTFYTFGGVPRRFSPLSFDATYRPKRSIFVNTRMDLGLKSVGIRSISATIGYNQKLLNFFQTFYYTRAITLIPSLKQFSNPFGKEAGTLRGSQWNPSLFLGNKDKGIYGGVSLFFDFQNRRAIGSSSPLISSIFTLGYALDCCTVTTQIYRFNVGARRENRFVFSFKLNGIGTFGTQNLGQGSF